MPRPGPRPYECVRRAWHSERHQPIRGSLIQEIFRLANEVHDPTTLKNKEWLEKLPLVVLKAEEIMYSKANSEAGYMDLETLWERANDAIDTIIRRDDAPETDGDHLLQPCIEAALNLGCIPRRASRSQRHNNPGCYLSSVNSEAQHLVSSAGHLLPLPSPHSSGQQSSLSRLESWYAAVLAANRPNRRANEVNSVVPDGSLEPKDTDTDPATNSLLHCQDGGAYNCPSFGLVNPLYDSDEQRKVQDPTGSTKRSLPSVCEGGMGLLCNFIGSESAKGALNTGSIFGEASKHATDGGCDLSLRLGMFSPPSSGGAWTHEVEDVGSSSSCNGSKHADDPSSGGARGVNFGNSFSSSMDKGFDFINMDSSDEPLESFSSKWTSEEEGIAMSRGF